MPMNLTSLGPCFLSSSINYSSGGHDSGRGDGDVILVCGHSFPPSVTTVSIVVEK